MTAAPSLAGSVRVTLPIKTTNPLNGSQGFTRGATMAAARRRKAQRSTVDMVVGTHLRVCRVGLPCTVTLTRIAPSAGLDSDGLAASLKAVRDGVADALGIDDRDPRVTWLYEQRRGSAKDLMLALGYGVEVRVEARPTNDVLRLHA